MPALVIIARACGAVVIGLAAFAFAVAVWGNVQTLRARRAMEYDPKRDGRQREG